MTIDESIAKERQQAKEQRSHIGTWDDEYSKKCEVYAEYHEQLAEWLEELKAYREIGTVEGYKSAIECYTEEYTRRKSREQYKKAIDDFADKFISFCDDGEFMARLNEFPATTILEMAEQLKEGGENEQA